MSFKPGHEKVGGRRKGSVNKSVLSRQQAVADAMRTLGLAPEAIDEITPLATMHLVMTARLRAGDDAGALIAAEAAPYMHTRLTSNDLRVTNPNPLDSMSDEELKAEIETLGRRIAESETALLPAKKDKLN